VSGGLGERGAAAPAAVLGPRAALRSGAGLPSERAVVPLPQAEERAGVSYGVRVCGACLVAAGGHGVLRR
jgi:hypothetical protein